METISIIIPCYNEEEAIPVYYETMVRQMNEMEEQQKVQFELIFVDDGSKVTVCLRCAGLRRRICAAVTSRFREISEKRQPCTPDCRRPEAIT